MLNNIVEALPVEPPKLIPLGNDQESIGRIGRTVWTRTVFDVRKYCSGFIHCLGVIRTYDGALGEEFSYQRNGWREAHVIGVWLECQTQHGDFLAVEYPKFFANLRDEMFNATLIDTFNFLKKRKITAGFFSDPDKRLEILWKAESSKPQARGEKR